MKSIIELKKGAVGLLLHIQPGAKKSEIVGEHDGALKVKIAAPPVDGKANEEVVAFFAKLLKVRKSDLEIVKGQTGRKKTLAISGMTVEEIVGRLSNSKTIT